MRLLSTSPDLRAIVGEERMTGLVFGDDHVMDCEMAVFATGTRPDFEIARSCGLTVERAIVVDDQMRSVDDSNIYAVGECVQHGGRTYGLVGPLWEQAKVLADHMTGRDPGPPITAPESPPSSRWRASSWPRWERSSPVASVTRSCNSASRARVPTNRS